MYVCSIMMNVGRVPVYSIHGSQDTVILDSETAWEHCVSMN